MCLIVVKLKFPFFGRGKYRIGLSNGLASEVTCPGTDNQMLTTCNNVSGQWRRVAYLDTNQTNLLCPEGLQTSNDNTSCKICGFHRTCSSVIYPTHGHFYSKVCGKVHAHYLGTPDGFQIFQHVRPPTPNIDDNYVDGVSLTYGNCPKRHIWTFSVDISTSRPGRHCCTFSPSFVSSNYFCESVPECSSEGSCRRTEL